MSAGPRTPMESHEMSTPATAMDDAPVLVERLTLNRPHALNAVNAELSAAVGTALEEADHDRDVVLTGAEDRAFCAGADLGEKRTPQWQAR
jgi:enoyl-CoA hydratase/carnithine racemase